MLFQIFNQTTQQIVETFEAENCSKAAEYTITKLGVKFGVDKNGFKTITDSIGKPLGCSLIAPYGYLVDLAQPSVIEPWIRRGKMYEISQNERNKL